MESGDYMFWLWISRVAKDSKNGKEGQEREKDEENKGVQRMRGAANRP